MEQPADPRPDPDPAAEPAGDDLRWKIAGLIAGMVGAAIVRALLHRQRTRSQLLRGWVGVALWPALIAVGATLGEAAGKRAIQVVRTRRPRQATGSLSGWNR